MFLGRTREMERIERLFADGASLVSIVGPGGAGKTRLCRELIRHGRLAGLVQFVALAGASDLAQMAARIEAALGGAGPASNGTWEDESARLAAALAELGPLTVVLDEAEAVIAPLIELLQRLAIHAPETRWLISSRQRLGLLGEAVVTLAGLEQADAIELYKGLIERRAGRWEDDELGVQRLLERLASLPLAIELGAAQAATVGLSAVLSWLERDPGSLQHQAPDLAARHQSLSACFSWSLDALPEPLAQVLRRLAVLRGTFDPELAALVLELSAEVQVLQTLEALEARSLLQSEQGPGGPTFRLFEPLRVLVLERLGAAERERVEGELARRLAQKGPEWSREIHGW